MVERCVDIALTKVRFFQELPDFEIDVEMSPLYASALFLEHDTPVAVQGSLNSLIRDKPMSP